ncbi:MAG: S8 family serine peptidase [Anaerolineaceae bacterium]
MKSKLTRFIAILIVLGMIVSPISAQSTPPTGSRLPVVDRSTLLSKPEAEVPQKFTEEHAIEVGEVDGKDPVRFVVILPDEPLATYKGEVASLAATAPSVTGTKLNVKTAESQAYLKYLQAQQSAYLTTASNVLGHAPKVFFQYQYGTNGFSMLLTPDEAALLAAQTGAKVLRAPIEQLTTDEGPILIGAPAVWLGETSSGVETFGEGVLVGIIDTGINFDHPSFSDAPIDGYEYEWAGDYLGVCAPDGDPDYATACNDKVVGAFTYVADDPVETSSPEDSEGHGSHTASTVAGNFVEVEFQGVATTISGVAPHAQVIAFDVCVPVEPNGACYGDATVAAVDDAIANGVDVINYSISGGANPYSDPVELAFLAATEAGIFVSTSAGNAGDTTGASSVAHRSPWVSTVAAASHGRIFANAVDITGPGAVPPTLIGLGAVQSGPLLVADLVNLPIKYDPTNVNGCAGYTAGFFDGAIALVQRGTCTFAAKEANAYAAGAEYVLIYNSRTGAPAGMAGIVTGAAMISMEDGLAIKAWIDANPTATATISAETSRIYNTNYEDIIAGFSSYGPNTTFDVLKPDITGPGVSILAAVADGTIAPSSDYEIELYQGTSMSSPHNAGAAALMMALHPDWTAMEIRSAMMMTAEDGLLADRVTIEGVMRPATPQDEGSGRIALENAAMVGLVMNETIANFEAADPTLDGNPASLNLASLYSSKCVGECTWTRTFTSVADVPATYTASVSDWVTVTPASFTIAAGGTQEVTFTADVAAFETDVWEFASVEFLTDDTHPGSVEELLSEDFEFFPPIGWTVDADPASCDIWLSTADTEADNNTGGTGFAADANSDFCGDPMDTWMISPTMDFTGYDSISLQFKSDFWDYGNLDDGYVDVSVDGGTTWTNVFHYEKADFYGPRTETIDLSTFAGETDVTLRFHYVAPDWDWWWQVDDVIVTATGGIGAPIADVHIPLAVLPTSSNIPALVKFDTHRDADAATLSDLIAVELTGANTFTTGLAKAELESFTLDPDPTPGDYLDDLSQIFVKKITVPAYTVRLVAEITASTSSDLDMFLYYDYPSDGVFTADDYLVASSATGAVLEYINGPKDFIYYNQPDTFYIVVQNYAGAAGDSVTLATGMVPVTPPAGNYEVVLPVTNPAGVPFEMDILWNEDTEEGDRLYGYFETYADDPGDIFIGGTDIDIHRLADDVVKTADVTEAGVGDTITYSIEITNYSTEPIYYSVNDILPAGVTYVPGSVTGGGDYDSDTNSIFWNGTVDASYRDYVATTSAVDPNCTLGFFADGDPTDAYLDWFTTANNFKAAAGLSYGDNMWYITFSTYPVFNYFGVDYTGIHFTAEGYTGFALPDGSYSNVNTPLPNSTVPNNIMAMFWDDFTVEYDLALNKGITMVGDSASFATIEYDDIKLNADPTKTMDMEIGYFLQPDDTPGAYEITYAFDNITPGLFAAASGTIGLENVNGTVGTQFSYNDTALEIADGSAICFDWALLPAPPVVITFQVTVDEDATNGELTNAALHDNDQLGTVEESAVAIVTISGALKNLYLPLIMR